MARLFQMENVDFRGGGRGREGGVEEEEEEEEEEKKRKRRRRRAANSVTSGWQFDVRHTYTSSLLGLASLTKTLYLLQCSFLSRT